MNILTIDTSTDIELIALSAHGKILGYCDYANMSHGITMFGNLSQLLAQASIKINEINLIGTGIGPGSFTGIRIAVSTARMFAQILKIPLVGIKSQEIYAASVQGTDNKTVLTAFDAKKSRVFAGVYTLQGSDPYKGQQIAATALHEIIEPGDYYMDELLESIKQRDIQELICVGDGCEKYIEVIDKFSKKNPFSYTVIDKFRPDGKSAIELTLKKYNESREKYMNFENTVPFYARRSDAEVSKSGS